MSKVFIHIGMQRCGTHAIANWIIKQREGRVTHTKHIKNGVFKYSFHNDDKVYFLNSQHIDKGIDEQRDSVLQELDLERDFYICIESGKLSSFKEELLLGDIFKNKQVIRLISLRDILNCYASFYKRYRTVPGHIGLEWESRAEEIDGKTNFLKGNWEFVNYNKWFKSREYRHDVCNRLNVNFTDRGLNDVPNFGNGSSFQGLEYDGNAGEMDVLSRYKQFENDPKFKRLLMNPYLQNLSRKVIGYNDRP